MMPSSDPSAHRSAASHSVVALLRSLFGMAHYTLQGVMHGVSSEDARRRPEGATPSIEAQLVHLAASEDFLVNAVARRSTPLLATLYSGRTGFDGQPPLTGWDEWAEDAHIDLAAATVYARGVFAATDYSLSTMSDADLERMVDADAIGLGTQAVGSVLALALQNCMLHTGEISAIKGAFGQAGYPQEGISPANAASAAGVRPNRTQHDPARAARTDRPGDARKAGSADFDPRFDDGSEPDLDPALAAELAELLG